MEEVLMSKRAGNGYSVKIVKDEYLIVPDIDIYKNKLLHDYITVKAINTVNSYSHSQYSHNQYSHNQYSHNQCSQEELLIPKVAISKLSTTNLENLNVKTVYKTLHNNELYTNLEDTITFIEGKYNIKINQVLIDKYKSLINNVYK